MILALLLQMLAVDPSDRGKEKFSFRSPHDTQHSTIYIICVRKYYVWEKI
jgi:hypothetical protein